MTTNQIAITIIMSTSDWLTLYVVGRYKFILR